MEQHVDRIRAQFTRQGEVYARMRQTTDQKGLDGLVALSGASATHRTLDVAGAARSRQRRVPQR